MIMIMVVVVETLVIMEIPPTLEKNHQDNQTTTQGEEMKGQLVIHNIRMNFKANHQDQIFQDRQYGIELIPLS